MEKDDPQTEGRLRCVTSGPEETRALGRLLGGVLRPGDVVTLAGELGAGKTVLAQGIAEGLGVQEPVSSPTFTLAHEYQGRIPVWHLDAYRLLGPEELADLGWDHLLSGGGALLIEWPERIAAALPSERLDVLLRLGEGDARELEFVGRGERWREALRTLEAAGCRAV